eukprot:8463304-Karenia_brevis.AAC.1
MGFGPSASWAQAYNDAAAEAVNLPQQQRLVDLSVAPTNFPIWGSIEDDFWAIEEESPDGTAPESKEWLRRIEDHWHNDGLE